MPARLMIPAAWLWVPETDSAISGWNSDCNDLEVSDFTDSDQLINFEDSPDGSFVADLYSDMGRTFCCFSGGIDTDIGITGNGFSRRSVIICW
jgi:hypothetical protein